MKIGTLLVEIAADSAIFNANINEANIKLRGLTERARAATTEIAKYASAAIAAGTATAAYLVKSAIDAVDAEQQLIKVSNATSKEFLRNAAAAKTVGIESEKLADIYKDMGDRVGDFLQTGGGPMQDFFTNIAPKVGVTAQQFKNLSGPQALQLFVNSLEKANLSQNEMTFYMEAIASDSTKLLPLLRNNGEEMARLGQRADQFGQALSDIDIEKVHQASVAMSSVREIFSGFVQQIAVRVAPILTALSNLFLDNAKKVGTVGGAADKTFNFLIEAISTSIDVLKKMGIAFDILKEGMIAGFNAIKLVVLKIFETIADAAQHLPGKAGKYFESFALEAKTQAEEANASIRISNEKIKESFNNLISPPETGRQFKEFVAQAVDAGNQAAAEAVKIQEAARAAIETGGGGGGGQPSITENQRQELQQKLKDLQDSYKNEQQLLIDKLVGDQQILNDARDAKLLSEQEYHDQSITISEDAQKKLTDIEKRESDKRTQAAQAEMDRKLSAARLALGSLSTLMNSESRKQFEIGKAAAIAGALVDAYRAMSGAYKVGSSIGGPVVGAAFAAAAGVAQFQTLQSIRSAQFGSGASTATGSVTTSINAQSTPVGGDGSSAANPSAQRLFVSGDFDEDSFFSGKRVVSLAKQLLDYQRDGGEVIFTQ